MGQQHHQAGHLPPFGFGGDDELIDDRLRHVDEIAELGFPDDQVARVGGAEAVFESQDGQLGKHGVDEDDGGLVFADIGQGDVFVAGVVIAKGGMAMGEGAALGVLADEADGRAFQQQASQRQHFGAAPVDRGFAERHFQPAFHQRLELGMNGKSVGNARGAFADFAENIGRNLGDGGPILSGA